MDNKPLLSVVVTVYNHERYIEKAIRSILEQKLEYPYEVLIGEDGSSDRSRQILKGLEAELPSNFHLFYRETNIGAKKNYDDLKNRTKGKYIIFLEGDDYWIYPYKLQKQIEFLETHPDYIAIGHDVVVIDEFGNRRIDSHYPTCKKEEYTLYDYRDDIYPGQTAAVMSRNNSHSELFVDNIELPPNSPGDKKRYFLLAAHGKVKVIQEAWSAYRLVTSGGSSWSAQRRTKSMRDEAEIVYRKRLYSYSMNELKTKESIIVAESIYFYLLLSFVLLKKEKKVSWAEWFQEFKNAKYKGRTMWYIIKKSISKVSSKR